MWLHAFTWHDPVRCIGQGRDLILQPASNSTGTPVVGGGGRGTDRIFDGSGLSSHRGISCHKQHAARVFYLGYAACACLATSTSVESLGHIHQYLPKNVLKCVLMVPLIGMEGCWNCGQTEVSCSQIKYVSMYNSYILNHITTLAVFMQFR